MNTTPPKIQASTATLLGNDGLLKLGNRYNIPVYQRAYSWDAEQIRRFFQTLISNFRSGREMSFLGTMLLLPAGEDGRWDVVDGQQRLTTFYLFFHYLELRGNGDLMPKALRERGWLHSKINGGQEQAAIEEALALSFQEIQQERNAQDNNRYAYRLHLIQREFEDLWDDAFDALEETQKSDALRSRMLLDTGIQDFLRYLTTEVQVVRIEARTPLAKTLDIFDTINTTGMALNGGDIFKIRMYDYLIQVKGLNESDDPFGMIDGVYAQLELANKDYAANRQGFTDSICDMQWVLMLYQHTLIERESINRTTHGLGASTFWDRFFRARLFREQVEDFRRDAEYLDRVALQDMRSIIAARFAWESPSLRTPRTHLMCRLMFYTRYGWRFWWLAVVYINRFDRQMEGSDLDPKLLERFVELLTKYYAIQSIKFAKVVNASITYTYDLIKLIIDPKESQQTLIGHLERAIQNVSKDHAGEMKLRAWLSGDLYYNYLLCRLVCVLVEFSSDLADLDSEEGAKHFHDGVFKTEYDLDHIMARDRYENLSPEEKAAWEPIINSIGNLTLLERDKNRSQGAIRFEEKVGNFRDSGFYSAQEVGQYQAWTLEACQNRYETILDRVVAWLLG